MSEILLWVWDFIVVPVASGWLNVASNSSGATCQASTEKPTGSDGARRACSYVTDGLLGVSSRWTPIVSDTNHWIQVGSHDDVIQWKHFPRYWPFVRGIHWWPVNSPHKGQWRGALMFSLICVWINGWVNNREAGDLRCHRAHYDVTVMMSLCLKLDVARAKC